MRGDSSDAYYEFFAGGGLARLGLGPNWRCAFANDIDAAKGRAYATAFGAQGLRVDDIWSLKGADLPGQAQLAWASFPCQDLSLAGARAGLAAPRSGAFWGFWRLIEALISEGRAPNLLVLENVTGLLSSHGGADFNTVCATLASGGYNFGALTIDAAHFTPQSRVRLFLVACRGEGDASLVVSAPCAPFHSAQLAAAAERLPRAAAAHWRWWRLPLPPKRNADLADLLEPDGAVAWHAPEATARLISLMSPRQRAALDDARRTGERRVGAVFRRVRRSGGEKSQRAEARFDGLAGCLRTPAGGSSRQSVIVTEGGLLRSRLLSPRECARLMGAPEDYPLPASCNASLQLLGDGVCVPVVRWLSDNLLKPLARTAQESPPGGASESVTARAARGGAVKASLNERRSANQNAPQNPNRGGQ